MLKILERELPKLWTDEFYSPEWKRRECPYKDFDHALKHILKAAVALQNMTEEADHAGMTGVFFGPFRYQANKYLADIVISVVRAALTHPAGAVDLEKVVRERVLDKMKAELPEA